MSEENKEIKNQSKTESLKVKKKIASLLRQNKKNK